MIHPESAAIVRPANIEDAKACAAIYAPYVKDTAITFETEPPSPAKMARRMMMALEHYAWLVLEQAGQVAGYAYAGAFHPRPGYKWACEVSVYLKQGAHRAGGGKALYEALLAQLRARGFRIAVAVMTLPNEASVGLHRAIGFQEIGTYRRIGFKQGSWHDVMSMQYALMSGEDPPQDLT